MENASEELKSRGWPVTLSNDECGVAAAIDRVLNFSDVAAESIALAPAFQREK